MHEWLAQDHDANCHSRESNPGLSSESPTLYQLRYLGYATLDHVKPWSSFQCTSIHHAVRVRAYKGDEHLAFALYKSMAPLPLSFLFTVTFEARSVGAHPLGGILSWQGIAKYRPLCRIQSLLHRYTK